MDNTKHVYAAIAEVMGKLAQRGIAKTQENTFDNYKFRGIDDVYNALAPLLADAALVVLPRVLERTSTERAARDGKAMFYIVVVVEFDFISVKDGSTHVMRVYGEAMDRGDKATNKAMSAAYKYAMIEAFCIPVAGSEDADLTSPEVVSRDADWIAAAQAVDTTDAYAALRAQVLASYGAPHAVPKDVADALARTRARLQVAPMMPKSKRSQSPQADADAQPEAVVEDGAPVAPIEAPKPLNDSLRRILAERARVASVSVADIEQQYGEITTANLQEILNDLRAMTQGDAT